MATYAVKVAFTGDPTKFFVGSNVTAAITTAQTDRRPPRAGPGHHHDQRPSTVTVATDGTADGPTETRTVTTGGRQRRA